MLTSLEATFVGVTQKLHKATSGHVFERMDLISRIFGTSHISRKARDSDSAHDRDQKTRDKNQSNSNFRTSALPVQPLMGLQLVLPSESCISKGSWLSFSPALLFGGATNWQILGCILGHNRDIYSGGRGSRAGL